MSLHRSWTRNAGRTSGRRRGAAATLCGLAAIVLFAVAQVAVAQQEDVIAAGKRIYMHKCAVCHGTEAIGNGPLAKELTTKPANLRRISVKHGGKFPFWREYAVIDGRAYVRAHGPRTMPVWGSSETEEKAGSTGHLAMGQMLELAFFLESIQEK